MKVGIVGSGFVGSTAGYALVMRGVGREIVLVDRNSSRAQAEAADIQHAVPFARPAIVRSGEYADLAGARVVIVAAGVNQQPGETRLQLLERNAAVFASVIPAILDAAPEAVLVIATNPVDVMTHVAARIASRRGVSTTRVLGSGTTLDTARFRSLVGQLVGVDSHHLHGYVIGEHGDSEVLTWSATTVGGMPLDEFCAERGIDFNDGVRATIDSQVRRAAYLIIQGKGATYYGIGSALARICEAVISDQRAILTVCSPSREIAGVRDATVSLPHLVGGTGVLDQFPLSLAPEEQEQLRRSAQLIRDLCSGLAEDFR